MSFASLDDRIDGEINGVDLVGISKIFEIFAILAMRRPHSAETALWPVHADLTLAPCQIGHTSISTSNYPNYGQATLLSRPDVEQS